RPPFRENGYIPFPYATLFMMARKWRLPVTVYRLDPSNPVSKSKNPRKISVLSSRCPSSRSLPIPNRAPFFLLQDRYRYGGMLGLATCGFRKCPYRSITALRGNVQPSSRPKTGWRGSIGLCKSTFLKTAIMKYGYGPLIVRG